MTSFTETENQIQYLFMRQRKEITLFSKKLHYKFLYLFHDLYRYISEKKKTKTIFVTFT